MPPARQTLELLRDVLRLFANFVREVGEIEKEHDFNFSELQKVLGDPDSTAFFSSLMELDPRVQLSFLRVIAKYTTLSKELQNPMALKATDKLGLAEKLDDLVADLEAGIGVSKKTSRPTDLDKQLVYRCAGRTIVML